MISGLMPASSIAPMDASKASSSALLGVPRVYAVSPIPTIHVWSLRSVSLGILVASRVPLGHLFIELLSDCVIARYSRKVNASILLKPNARQAEFVTQPCPRH